MAGEYRKGKQQWGRLRLRGTLARAQCAPRHRGKAIIIESHRPWRAGARSLRDPAARSNARTAGRDTPLSVGGASPHEHDDELGLINMKGRLYDPRLRRVLTPYPLVSGPTADGWNPYAYALNSPTAFVDPSSGSGSGLPGVRDDEACFEVKYPESGPFRANPSASSKNSECDRPVRLCHDWHKPRPRGLSWIDGSTA